MRLLESIGQDIRYALRTMRSSAGLTAVAILSLALGIGATTAIFSVAYALVFKPLPVLQPYRLVEVARGDGVNYHSYAEWKQFRVRQDIFSGVFAYNTWDTHFSLKDGEEKREVSGLYVTGDYFPTLGIPAIIGRTLEPSDDQTGAAPVCVISYGLWRRQFGQSPIVLGRTVVLNGHGLEVVGVAPRSFFGVEVGDIPEVFIPLEMEKTFGDYQKLPNGRATPTLDDPYHALLKIVARLKPGVSVSQADARLRVLGPEVYKTLPPLLDKTGHPFPPGTFIARSMPNGISYERYLYRDTVLLVLMMAGVSLIIACANLGNLLLARATKRQGEIATRLALGATRWRLVRQLLTESIALSVAGAATGLIIEPWGSEALVSAISFSFDPTALDLSWDAELVAFTVGTTLLCALLFGLAPAIRATRLSLYSAMNNGSTVGRGRHQFSNAFLIVVQVTLSMALLVSAGLLVRTVRALLAKDPGYEAKGVLVAEANWQGPVEGTERQAFEGDELLKRFISVSGVISASASAPSGGTSLPTIIISQPGGPERRPRSYRMFVSPGFFRTRRTPMLSGRDFNIEDNNASLPVAILSDQAAKTFFQGVNPIGLRYIEREEDGENKGRERWIEVVGVAKDIDYERPSDAALAIVYRSASQCLALCSPLSSYEIRFAGSLPNLTRRLKDSAASVDSHVALNFHMLADERNDAIRRNRAMASIATFFGFFAGLLAMIGVYGVTSYATSERRREIGIRMALGAQPRNVFRMILRETATLVFVGVVLGVAAGFGAAQMIREMLWGVTPTDPLTISSAACLVLIVAGIASFLPARRASKADPMVTLRFE